MNFKLLTRMKIKIENRKFLVHASPSTEYNEMKSPNFHSESANPEEQVERF